MRTKEKQAFDRSRLVAINPQTTNQPAERCGQVRTLFELLVREGKSDRPTLLEKSGLSDRQLERALSAGCKLEPPLWIRKIRSFLPDPQPDIYSASFPGFKSLERKTMSVPTSPLHILNHKERELFRRVAWNKVAVLHYGGKMREITLHEAWLIACLAAVVKSKPQANRQTLIAAGFPGDIGTLGKTESLAAAVGIYNSVTKKGPGKKSSREFDFDSLGKLPRLGPDEAPLQLESQRWIDRPGATKATKSSVSDEDQRALEYIPLKSTGLKTQHQLSCVVRVVLAVGDIWNKTRHHLASQLGCSTAALENWIEWAKKAGFITTAPSRGSEPGTLTVEWVKIREKAGEVPKVATNGHTTSSTNAEGKDMDHHSPVFADSTAARKATRVETPAIVWSSYEPPSYWAKVFVDMSWKTIRRRVAAGKLHGEELHKQAWRFALADLPANPPKPR